MSEEIEILKKKIAVLEKAVLLLMANSQGTVIGIYKDGIESNYEICQWIFRSELEEAEKDKTDE
jgi:hypothetical protein